MAKSMFERIVDEATGGKARVFTANSIDELVEKVKSDFKGDSCGNPECPVHGEPKRRTNLLGEEDIAELDAAGALNLAIGALAGAHNALMSGRVQVADSRAGVASLWLEIRDRLDDKQGLLDRINQLETEAAEMSLQLSSSSAALRDARIAVNRSGAKIQDLEAEVQELRNRLNGDPSNPEAE